MIVFMLMDVDVCMMNVVIEDRRKRTKGGEREVCMYGVCSSP